ncbi:Shedu immune nuclease family protein [Galbibacter sp. BG1]
MSNFKLTNYEIEKLYNHSVDKGNIEKGRFFQVLFNDDDTGFDIKLSSQIYMRTVFYPTKNDIESLEIIKVKNGKNTERILFSKFNFQQLELFLQFLKDVDLSSISDKKLKLADNSLDILDENTKKQIATLLSGEQGAETIQNLLNEGAITSEDIINTGYRKAQLKIFERLLTEEKFLQDYKRQEKKISELISDFQAKQTKPIDEKSKDEIAWQYFFNKNPWIFGYGLDYRFQNILQKEFSASDTDASGKGQVNTDFLMGDNNFTTFVEIKKPNTDIFDNKLNRSGSWKLSKELTYAVSQILEQKTRGELKIRSTKNLPLSNDTYLKQESYDSKCILIFGNLEDEIAKCSEPQKDVMKRTFELYRRNSKNIEILTYDELYERAKYICNIEKGSS